MTKKRVITLLIAIVMIATLLTGCIGDKSKITQSNKNVDEATALGNYFLYETKESEDYLSFLENFDDTKYEIVDISIGYNGTTATGKHINLYAVTYRAIAE